jgi:Homeodomain-like domain-containing protein
VRFCGMRTGVAVHLSPTDRKRLRSIVDDRNSLQKHVWRARIVLTTADGVGTVEIMRTAGVSKTAVGRWQARFMDEGVHSPESSQRGISTRCGHLRQA